MSDTNVTIVLAERPHGEIIPGKTFVRKETPKPKEEDLQDDQILVEALYISIDPAMRPRLNESRSYAPPLAIGEHFQFAASARVIASRNPSVPKGSLVLAYSGWTRYAVLSPGQYRTPAELHTEDPIEMHSLVGSTSLTAWVGMMKIAKPKAGETVVVSGAAGGVGSVAGQIAKIAGARVIGIAGGPEKCRWVKEDLGFDVALDYKSDDFKTKFEEATKDFIDVYFDNVGGEILDMCLARANTHARFAICGAVSQYNKKEHDGIKNFWYTIAMRITLTGFLLPDYYDICDEGRRDLVAWHKDGKLKVTQTVVPGGMDVLDKTLADMHKGVNTGKLLVEVAKP